MKINFYATLRPIIGQKTVELDVAEGVTAQQLIEQIVTEYPPLRAELLDENGKFFDYMKFFINGREVTYLEDQFDTVIKPEDKIDVFPPVGGG